MILLERRLDNVIYRSGFAASRANARQVVAHAHLTVNGHPVDIPSYLVKAGDKIAVRENSRPLTYWKVLGEEKNVPGVPQWLSPDRSTLSIIVQSLPTREQIEAPVKEQLVVEYYSR